MKLSLIFFLCATSLIAQAQTSTELIGKWKLVKETKDGVVKQPQDTYQIFKEGGVFEGVSGGKSKKGKWNLSNDNKELTVKVSVVSVKFKVEYFDAKKRMISSDLTGTLEYEKVPD
ncbi:MAG: glycoside hydrolase family 43 C-terminal domain-containing protein [Chryseolinea sp.]